MTSMPTYRLDAPLRRGITLVEASAGTGKTYGIASLFVRLIAEEGLTIDRILVVTFTEAATLELRDRLRRRLADALRLLRGEGDIEDAGVAILWTDDEAEHRRRVARIEAAVSAFDRALVSTIHGFCQRVLAFHAFECGVELDRELLTDIAPVVEEAVDDYLARLLHGADELELDVLLRSARMSRDSLIRIARATLADKDAPLVPDEDAPYEDALAAFRSALERFEALYGVERDRALGVIEAAIHGKPRRLDGRRYRAGSVESNAAKMDTFLEAPSLEAIDDRFAAYFSKEQLRDATKEGPPIEDPVFDAWSNVRERAQELRATLHVPRLRFVKWLREEVHQRLVDRGQGGFDDLVRSVADGLSREEGGDALARKIRERFDAALLDEFQDTDADQWSIFSSVFGDGERFLYLIGDPKQAIYGFRGADVHVYARAARRAGEERRFTMRVNHRSDAGYVDAMNALFGAREDLFDLEFVRYVEVQAARRDRLRFSDSRAPLRLRYFDGTLDGGSRILTKGRAESLVPELMADDIVECLRTGSIEEAGELRSIRPTDLAVLVRKNRQAQAVQRALLRRNVPAIVGAVGTVFDSTEASLFELFLSALVESDREGRARAFALSSLGGLPASAADRRRDEDSPEWVALLEDLSDMRLALESHGVRRAYQLLLERRDVVRRWSAEVQGERSIVNLGHVAELLHRSEASLRLGPSALLGHLRAAREGGERGEESDALRLESDDDAVRIVTLHKSKGLEYPIVFLGHLWDGGLLGRVGDDLLRFHDPRNEDRLTFDLCTGPDRDREAHRAIAEREVMQESVRLAYVGFTRARHMAVAYFGPVNSGSGDGSREGYERSALACLLHGHAAAENESLLDAVRARVEGALDRKADGDGRFEEVFQGDLTALVHRAGARGARIDVTDCEAPRLRTYAPERPSSGELVRRSVSRAHFDTVWGRHSYSGLLHRAEGRAAQFEGDRGHGWDESSSDMNRVETPRVRPADDDAAMPLSTFPRGASAGTFIHQLLERVDFRDGTCRVSGTPLLETARALGRRAGFSEEAQLGVLADALPLVFDTPFGGPAGDFRLSTLSTNDRIDEMAFDLPIRAAAYDSAADELIAAIRLREPDERLSERYHASLASLRFPRIRGFFTGTIDLVFRAEIDGRPRYFIADYKSNSLGVGEPHVSMPEHYGLAGMRLAMEEHHYYLQYHFYLVALHRLLSHRLGARYDYERDVGGAYYLFIRGMLGSATAAEGGVVRGVFFDKPPLRVVEALSSLFGEPPEAS